MSTSSCSGDELSQSSEGASDDWSAVARLSEIEHASGSSKAQNCARLYRGLKQNQQLLRATTFAVGSADLEVKVGAA